MLKCRFPGGLNATGPLHDRHNVGKGTAILVAQGVGDKIQQGLPRIDLLEHFLSHGSTVSTFETFSIHTI